MIQLVFAHSGLDFGSHDGMPWPHISQDFKNFKDRTYHTTLVMGAKTFESLPGLLPGRQHFVVVDPTRGNPVAKNGDVAHQYISINSFERMMQGQKDTTQVISVIGGVSLLEYAIDYASKVVHTQINLSDMDKKQVTTKLSDEFMDKVMSFGEQTERHWWKIDQTTSILESVLIREA